jgi:hypothetical protein
VTDDEKPGGKGVGPRPHGKQRGHPSFSIRMIEKEGCPLCLLSKPYEWCRVLDALREQDFIHVRGGGTVNLYGNANDMGFAAGTELHPANFVEGGEYRLRFLYSTASRNSKDWLGWGDATPALLNLLDEVPKTTVESNELKIKVQRRQKK